MPPARFALLPFCVCALACATVQSPGTFTHPGKRPEVKGPQVALTALRCDEPGVSESDEETTTEYLDRSVDARLGAMRVQVSKQDQGQLCGQLAQDRALYEDALFGTKWDVDAQVAAAVKRVAAQSHVDHVWVPVVRPKTACAPSGDSYQQAPAQLGAAEETNPCVAAETDLGLFLFDANGQLLWKSSAVAGRSELATREVATTSLLANVPAPARSEALVKETPP